MCFPISLKWRDQLNMLQTCCKVEVPPKGHGSTIRTWERCHLLVWWNGDTIIWHKGVTYHSFLKEVGCLGGGPFSSITTHTRKEGSLSQPLPLINDNQICLMKIFGGRGYQLGDASNVKTNHI